MDAILPFVENLTAMDRLQDSDGARDIPIILLYRFSQLNFQRAALDHGAKGLLVKSVEWDQLENCLSPVLRREALNNSFSLENQC